MNALVLSRIVALISAAQSAHNTGDLVQAKRIMFDLRAVMKTVGYDPDIIFVRAALEVHGIAQNTADWLAMYREAVLVLE